MMTPEISAWRASDRVAYDAMRASLDAAIAALLRNSSSSAGGEATAIARVVALRAEAFGIEGFDRAAVDAFQTRLDAILAEVHAGTT